MTGRGSWVLANEYSFMTSSSTSTYKNNLKHPIIAFVLQFSYFLGNWYRIKFQCFQGPSVFISLVLGLSVSLYKTFPSDFWYIFSLISAFSM